MQRKVFTFPYPGDRSPNHPLVLLNFETINGLCIANHDLYTTNSEKGSLYSEFCNFKKSDEAKDLYNSTLKEVHSDFKEDHLKVMFVKDIALKEGWDEATIHGKQLLLKKNF